MLADTNQPIESSTIQIRPVRTEEEWDDARFVRTQVFITEQECPPELEWDEHEAMSRHIVGYEDGRPIAAARWRTVSFEGRLAAKLERFAVLPEHRRKGYGRRLVTFVMDDARKAGFSTFVLHAQRYLEDFYVSFGFKRVGDIFFEAGIPHIKMVLRATAER